MTLGITQHHNGHSTTTTCQFTTSWFAKHSNMSGQVLIGQVNMWADVTGHGVNVY